MPDEVRRTRFLWFWLRVWRVGGWLVSVANPHVEPYFDEIYGPVDWEPEWDDA